MVADQKSRENPVHVLPRLMALSGNSGRVRPVVIEILRVEELVAKARRVEIQQPQEGRFKSWWYIWRGTSVA
jgi:hypothetical protein